MCAAEQFFWSMTFSCFFKQFLPLWRKFAPYPIWL